VFKQELEGGHKSRIFTTIWTWNDCSAVVGGEISYRICENLPGHSVHVWDVSEPLTQWPAVYMYAPGYMEFLGLSFIVLLFHVVIKTTGSFNDVFAGWWTEKFIEALWQVAVVRGLLAYGLSKNEDYPTLCLSLSLSLTSEYTCLLARTSLSEINWCWTISTNLKPSSHRCNWTELNWTGIGPRPRIYLMPLFAFSSQDGKKWTRSIWKMLRPFATAIRRTPPVLILHCHSPGVATVDTTTKTSRSQL